MPTEWNNVANGQRTDATQLTQVFLPINRLESGAAYWGAETTGSSTAYLAALTPAAGNNTEGTIANLLIHEDCGEEPTLSLNGRAALPFKSGGALLGEGDLKAGSVVQAICAGNAWHLIGAGSISLETIRQAIYSLGYGGIPDDSLIPSYDNTGGMGNRTSIISVTNFPSGLMFIDAEPNLVATYPTEAHAFNPRADGSGSWIKFDFGLPVLITEAQWVTQSNNMSGVSSNIGTWQWEGSNNDSSWSPLGAAFAFDYTALVDVPPPNAWMGYQLVFDSLASNSQLWRYYRLKCLSGSWANYTVNNRWIYFKIAGL